jgi:hypothetical protein
MGQGPMRRLKSHTLSQVGPPIVIGILAGVRTFDVALIFRRQQRPILLHAAAVRFPMDVS